MIPLLNLTRLHAPLRDDFQRVFDELLESSRFIDARAVDAFCAAFAAWQNIPHCIGCANGTEALRIAISAAIGQGDGSREIITVSHTFIATAESILASGYRPVFVDIEPTTGLMNLDRLPPLITESTAAIVPVHLYGQMVDMKRLSAIARTHHIALIEDAAQAHGASRDGVEPGQLSAAAGYSFFPGKNLGAFGDAGAVVTGVDPVAEAARLAVDHGRPDRRDGGGKNEHRVFSGNSRMDALQARILGVKLPHLDTWNARRRSIAAAYCEALASVPGVEPLEVAPGSCPVFHQFVVRCRNRAALRTFLESRGIATGVHYPVPIHRQPAYHALTLRKGAHPHNRDERTAGVSAERPSLIETERLAAEIVSIPVCPTMSDDEVECVIDALRAFAGNDWAAPPRPIEPANQALERSDIPATNV